MWVSYSPDLYHWGNPRVMMLARRGGWWDANKIGLSTPPLETPDGWLVIYHGVRDTPARALYQLGLALFDLDDLRSASAAVTLRGRRRQRLLRAGRQRRKRGPFQPA